MARNTGEFTVTLSVLDRLLDEDPGASSEAPMTRAQSVRRLKDSVRRDLEWLLNTRRQEIMAGESFNELNRSVFAFGLPDFTGYSLASPADRARLMRHLQWAVKTYEPRLASVHIVPVETSEAGSHTLRFRIEGLLLMDPAPEQVSFDTVLELTSGEYQVKGDADAR